MFVSNLPFITFMKELFHPFVDDCFLTLMILFILVCLCCNILSLRCKLTSVSALERLCERSFWKEMNTLTPHGHVKLIKSDVISFKNIKNIFFLIHSGE